VRRLISEARVDEAGALLGHPYYIDGTIVEGRRRGREIGFPTANLTTENELLPPHGVYATTLTIEGTVWPGLTNIGLRPTFGETEPTIETHVLGYQGDLYGKRVRLGFVLRLRDERRFEDVDALRAQIDADQRRAVRLFTRLSV
jgi:riboflavin kinase/FMN adenylyltransferase